VRRWGVRGGGGVGGGGVGGVFWRGSKEVGCRRANGGGVRDGS